MKYIVLIGDGMADYPLPELGDRTPLEAAHTPGMDYIAQHGTLGRTRNIPATMTPGSDVATISIMGYDPTEFYTGRGPLEAANLGIDLEPEDVAFRCNLVTISQDTLVDYSAGHITSPEASELIAAVNQKLAGGRIAFYPGVSYRHLMVVKGGATDELDALECKPPHDIAGQRFLANLPQGKNSKIIIDLMERSREVLDGHEINHVRIDLKENPGNMIWLWGQGKKPAMPKFAQKFAVSGSVISAVDLIKGLGRILGLDVINVPGATGYYDTDYAGKARAAIASLKNHDFVFVHVEAPDEAGHNGDLPQKILAIERFDQFIVGAFLQEYKDRDDFRILVMPDHATPLSLKTHTSDAIPFAVFGAGVPAKNFAAYSEKEAAKSDLSFDKGHELMEYFIRGIP
jgi:2,3-bisphosphoglycerate-independent phosphoglycerate mutase